MLSEYEMNKIWNLRVTEAQMVPSCKPLKENSVITKIVCNSLGK